jgi:hypothetical protein
MAKTNLSATSNTAIVTIGKLDLYFSYKTLVAFRLGTRLCVSENQWTKTTAKHLSQFGFRKEDRMPADQFNEILERLTTGVESLTV